MASFIQSNLLACGSPEAKRERNTAQRRENAAYQSAVSPQGRTAAKGQTTGTLLGYCLENLGPGEPRQAQTAKRYFKKKKKKENVFARQTVPQSRFFQTFKQFDISYRGRSAIYYFE